MKTLSNDLPELLKAEHPSVQLAPGVCLLNLHAIGGGVQSILDRLPSNTAAVYAWFRRLDFPADSSPETVYSALVGALDAAHSTSRSARLAPAHRITLSADTRLTEGKRAALRACCEELEFRELIQTIFHLSLVFQQPLYIGKAMNLQTRIKQHLSAGSSLRKRLADGRIRIDSCRLLYVIVPGVLSELRTGSPQQPDSDEEAEDIALLPIELLVEDLLSRLFLPSFTIRYG